MHNVSKLILMVFVGIFPSIVFGMGGGAYKPVQLDAGKPFIISGSYSWDLSYAGPCRAGDLEKNKALIKYKADLKNIKNYCKSGKSVMTEKLHFSTLNDTATKVDLPNSDCKYIDGKKYCSNDCVIVDNKEYCSERSSNRAEYFCTLYASSYHECL